MRQKQKIEHKQGEMPKPCSLPLTPKPYMLKYIGQSKCGVTFPQHIKRMLLKFTQDKDPARLILLHIIQSVQLKSGPYTRSSTVNRIMKA